MKRVSYFIFFTFILSGCIYPPNGIHIYNDTDMNSAFAESIIEADERIKSANVIFHNDLIVSGIVIKTFPRFHKKKIENELKEELERAYPTLQVTISSDYKMVQKTTKILKGNFNEQLHADLEKIISLLEEET